jgi:hypothetical protein
VVLVGLGALAPRTLGEVAQGLKLALGLAVLLMIAAAAGLVWLLVS